MRAARASSQSWSTPRGVASLRLEAVLGLGGKGPEGKPSRALKPLWALSGRIQGAPKSLSLGRKPWAAMAFYM